MGRTRKWLGTFVVCDGMGGYSEDMRQVVWLFGDISFEQNCGIHDPKDFIQQTILHANTKVSNQLKMMVSKGMGTTVTLLLKEVTLLGMASW